MRKSWDHTAAAQSHAQVNSPQILDSNQDMLVEDVASARLVPSPGPEADQEYDQGIQLDDDSEPEAYYGYSQVQDYPTEDDLQLCLVPQTQHYEFWEMKDQELFVCYAQLQLLFKDPARWNQAGGRVECPEPRFVGLECSTVPATPRDSRYDPHNFQIKYEIPCLDCTGSRPGLSSSQMIWIDSSWERLYGWPPPSSENRRHTLGWTLKFRIPLDKRSFEKKHTRIFQVTSELCFHRWHEDQITVVTSMTSQPVRFTVSYLSLISPFSSPLTPVPHGTASSTGSRMVPNRHISCADWEQVESMFARVNPEAISA